MQNVSGWHEFFFCFALFWTRYVKRRFLAAECTIIWNSRCGPRRRYFYMLLSDVYSYALVTKDVADGRG